MCGINIKQRKLILLSDYAVTIVEVKSQNYPFYIELPMIKIFQLLLGHPGQIKHSQDNLNVCNPNVR